MQLLMPVVHDRPLNSPEESHALLFALGRTDHVPFDPFHDSARVPSSELPTTMQLVVLTLVPVHDRPFRKFCTPTSVGLLTIVQVAPFHISANPAASTP